MKYFLSTILGLIAGFVSISLLEYVFNIIFPLPTGIDVKSVDSMIENMDRIPMVNMILVIVSYALSSLIAGFISVKIKTLKPIGPVLTIGVLFTAACFINFNLIPHPLWMVLICSITFVPMTWLGGQLGLYNNKGYNSGYSVSVF